MVHKNTYQYVLVCVSMVAIPLFNVASEVWDSVWLSNNTWAISGTYAVLSSWGLPMLIASIGGLVLSNGMTYSVKYMYTHYLPKAFFGCIVWWTVLGLIYMKNEYPNDLDLDTFFECLSTVLDIPYNTAFLQLIVALVVFYPLLKGIADSHTLTKYAFIVTYTITSLLPALELVPYIKNLTLFTNQIDWNFFTPFGTFLFLGVYLSRYTFEDYQRIVVYCMGILSLVAMFTCTVFLSSTEIGYNHTLVGYSSPFLVPIVIAVFTLIKSITYKCTNLSIDYVSTIAKCSYVYIPCTVISRGIINCFMDMETMPITVGIPLQALVTVLISMLLAICFKSLPVVKYFTM